MGLFFLLYPWIEFAAWWYFIDRFGWGDAFLWCLSSALVGSTILKLQGGAGPENLQTGAGGLPAKKVIHRLLISVGAFLLILPGLATDLIGALLILPGLRHFFVWLLAYRFSALLRRGAGVFAGGSGFHTFVFSNMKTSFGGTDLRSESARDVTGSGPVIDVSAVEISSQRVDEKGSSNPK